MRRIIAVVLIFFAVPSYAAESLSQQVADLWVPGKEKEGVLEKVLQIAEQRLAADPNDMAGLILNMNYNFASVNISDLIATYNRIEKVGSTIDTPRFKEAWPAVLRTLRTLQKIAADWTPEAQKQDRQVKKLPPFLWMDVLALLEEEGLVK